MPVDAGVHGSLRVQRTAEVPVQIAHSRHVRRSCEYSARQSFWTARAPAAGNHGGSRLLARRARPVHSLCRGRLPARGCERGGALALALSRAMGDEAARALPFASAGPSGPRLYSAIRDRIVGATSAAQRRLPFNSRCSAAGQLDRPTSSPSSATRAWKWECRLFRSAARRWNVGRHWLEWQHWQHY